MGPVYSNEKEFLSRCLQGDRAAWESFVQYFMPIIYKSIHRTFQVSNFYYTEEDSADIANGIFLSLIDKNYRKLGQFKGKNGCSLGSWLRVVAVRATIDFMRKSIRWTSIEESPVVRADPPDEAVERADMERKMDSFIKELPPKEQLLIKLYYEKGLSPSEIASAMNLLIGTVYSMKNKIKEKVKKMASDEKLSQEKRRNDVY